MAVEDLKVYNEDKYNQIHEQIMDVWAANPGIKQKQIANKLGICRSTVRRHFKAENQGLGNDRD